MGEELLHYTDDCLCLDAVSFSVNASVEMTNDDELVTGRGCFLP